MLSGSHVEHLRMLDVVRRSLVLPAPAGAACGRYSSRKRDYCALAVLRLRALSARATSLSGPLRLLFAPTMRRLSPDAVGDVAGILRILLAFRQGQPKSGSRLPIYSDCFLAFLGMRPEGITISELREYFQLGRSSTSRTCSALAREGLVHVGPAPEDRRRTLVRLTPKGQRIIDDALTAYRGRGR